MEQLFPGMRIGSFVWRTKDTANNSRDRAFSGVHEHVLVYAGPSFRFNPEMAASGKYRRLPGDDRESRLDPITMAQDLHNRPNTYYPIYNENTDLWYRAHRCVSGRFGVKANLLARRTLARP
jgi:adenine-specific DNA-methyltransferase